MSEAAKNMVKQELTINREALNERYLGLSTTIGRLKADVFEYITERARSKMNGWGEKNLSCVGKEVLLKSVVQALPTYSMSCFKLSKTMCKKLASNMVKFWWSGKLDRRSLHWISWNNLFLSKAMGGMGFRDLQLFNLALLAKQGWRLLTNPNSLCSRVLKGRYFPDQDFMAARIPRRASATWRAIAAGKEALKVGIIYRIGNGERVSIWDDNWIPGSWRLKPMRSLTDHSLRRVSELIDHGRWNENIIKETFLAPDAEAILNIPLRTD
uniref:Reverse transcriptase zinc-binding domain-containing protein n=1 Tax=Arundo donax TaxID=35708 RepID=A0A0A9C7D5_ARUDO